MLPRKLRTSHHRIASEWNSGRPGVVDPRPLLPGPGHNDAKRRCSRCRACRAGKEILALSLLFSCYWPHTYWYLRLPEYVALTTDQTCLGGGTDVPGPVTEEKKMSPQATHLGALFSAPFVTLQSISFWLVGCAHYSY